MVNEMFRDYPTKETTGRELGGARSSIPPARHSSYCRNRLHVTVESLPPRHVVSSELGHSYCRNRLHVTVESLPPRHVVSSELGHSYCRNRLHVTVESCHLDTWYLASSGSRTFSYCAVLLCHLDVVSSELWQSHILVLCGTVAKTQQLLPQSITRDRRVLPPRHVVSSELWQSPFSYCADVARHSSYCRNRYDHQRALAVAFSYCAILSPRIQQLLPQSITRDRRVLPPRHVVSSELWQSHILVLCDTVAKTQQLLPQSITRDRRVLPPRHVVSSELWHSYCRNRLHVTIESLPPRHVVSSELWQSHILVLCDTVAKTQQLLPQSITRDRRVLPPRHVVSSELWQSHILVLCDTVAKTQQLLQQSITRDRRVLPPRHVVSSGLWQSHILVLCDTWQHDISKELNLMMDLYSHVVDISLPLLSGVQKTLTRGRDCTVSEYLTM
ncbi:hypothetical protein J6590_045108 [Homalodisca vitripennis]|nr:hypothetical protein J6590_045108 [Homalodisca vitripennis]